MQAQPWWRSAVIYEICIRSFFDGNGDGVSDLSGLTEKLDYIASLGVDARVVDLAVCQPLTGHEFGCALHDNKLKSSAHNAFFAQLQEGA